MTKSYDAFLSYSSEHDKDAAQQFERGFRTINKKWLKLSAQSLATMEQWRCPTIQPLQAVSRRCPSRRTSR